MIADDASSTKQVGFIAQNLEQYFPWLVKTDERGFKSVSYAGMTPILTQAIKELNNKFSGVYNDIVFWVKELKADKVTTKELCVEDTCVTKDQFLKMVQQANVENAQTQSTPSSSPTATPASTPDSTSTPVTVETPVVPATPIPESSSSSIDNSVTQ